MSGAKLYSRFEIPDPATVLEDAIHGIGPSGDLKPFSPAPVQPGQVEGQAVHGWGYAGTYGMGGPGFFALRLDAGWLVVALWGAMDWMTAEGRLLSDMFHTDHGRPTPWVSEQGDWLAPRLEGRRLATLEVERHALSFVLDDGFTIQIEKDPSGRPAFAGNGQPRAFAPDEDLRTAVFLSPTTELWI